MIFGESHEGQWSQPMQDMLKGAPRNIAYNRFGISIVQHMGQRISVVVLSAACVEVDPLVPGLVTEGPRSRSTASCAPATYTPKWR